MINHEKKNIEKIFSEYYVSLVIYANKFLRNKTLSEDVVQDVFVRLIEKEVHEEKLTASYLYRCIHNQAIDTAVSKKITITLEEKHRIEERDFDIEEELERTNQLIEIHRAIDTLPESCQEIFREVYLKKQKYEQVAKNLNISIHTVKTQMFRAMKKLREQLNLIIFA